MERQKFEEEWSDAFQASERSPSETVWTNIELQLERDSSGSMKRRLLMFQLLAAASMVFAMGVGSFYYLNSGPAETNSNPIADSKLGGGTSQPGDSKSLANSESQTDMDQKSSTEAENTLARPSEKPGESHLSNNSQIAEIQTTKTLPGYDIVAVDTDVSNNEDFAISDASSNSLVDEEKSADLINTRSLSFNDRPLPLITSHKDPKLHFEEEPEADPGLALLARLEQEERILREEDEKDNKILMEKLWTSVGFSAGTYNPSSNSPSGTASFASQNSVTAGNSSSTSASAGAAYSIGVTVGSRIAKRLVIQGGISYLNQNAAFTSSASSGSKVALNEFALNSDRVTATNPYEVNTNLQYVSVPVQAGYYLLDRSFSIQLNGGVSTDFFLRSTLSSENSQFEDISAGPGEESPYRSVNFSGLVGTEFSYRFSKNYQLAVNPGLRYALNSIYKTDVAASLAPVTFDIGVRFKYVFPM